MLADNGICCID
jgi:DNA replication licensing factor MCM6